VRGRREKGDRLFVFERERVCVNERVCVLACCVRLFVWTLSEKEGGKL